MDRDKTGKWVVEHVSFPFSDGQVVNGFSLLPSCTTDLRHASSFTGISLPTDLYVCCCCLTLEKKYPNA